MVMIAPQYELKEKRYDIEYKIGPFNVFSKETLASEYCEGYYSSRETINKPLDGIDIMATGSSVSSLHDCKDTKYYLTFKPTLMNTPIEFAYVSSSQDKVELEQHLKSRREAGDSGMEFSDDIEEIGYILKTKEVTCSRTYETLDNYKSLVQLFNIASFVISLVFIFLVIFIYKKRYRKKI